MMAMIMVLMLFLSNTCRMQKTIGPCTILMCFTLGLEITDTLMGTALSILRSFHWPCWLHTDRHASRVIQPDQLQGSHVKCKDEGQYKTSWRAHAYCRHCEITHYCGYRNKLLGSDAERKRQLLTFTFTYLHNSHFTDPLFELSQTEFQIGQYNTIQYNTIAQYIFVIVQQLCTVYDMNVTHYFV